MIMYVNLPAHIQFSIISSYYLKKQLILTVKISKVS